MLEGFTVETFTGHVGERFRLAADDGVELDTELIEATALAEGPGEGGRTPFSIVFRGPPDPVLPQRIYGFLHPELGEFELFVVPIGPDERGMRYEAVFT